MNKRRRQGATLGLVAVCVLVIIVVGIGCFFLAKIFGGGREVANATDAGVLNIAKNAMRIGDPNVGVVVTAANYPNFQLDGQAASTGGQTTVNLLTYNRCVAQTLLVALNAKAEGTSKAVTAAQGVVAELNKLSTALTALLQNQATMTTYFNAVKNDTRMWGNTGVNTIPSTYATAWMKQGTGATTGGATNIYFTQPEFLAYSQLTGTNSTGTLLPPTGAGFSYMMGYPAAGTQQQAFTVSGITTSPIIPVPVFPQQTPHLVSSSDSKRRTKHQLPGFHQMPLK